MDWSNPVEVREYMREYRQSEAYKAKQRKYYQSEAGKAYQRKYYQSEAGKATRRRSMERRKFPVFSWDDMAELIREYGTVDISTLPIPQQTVFRAAGEMGIIKIEGNIASKTALTHALDGYVDEVSE